jgi:hypothetical protein
MSMRYSLREDRDTECWSSILYIYISTFMVTEATDILVSNLESILLSTRIVSICNSLSLGNIRYGPSYSASRELVLIFSSKVQYADQTEVHIST